MPYYVPSEILKDFQVKYTVGDIWQIHTGETWLTVFLYCNDQIESNKELPIYKEMVQEFTNLARKYLQLSEKQLQSINLNFDSKENFETKYRSNWQFYYT